MAAASHHATPSQAAPSQADSFRCSQPTDSQEAGSQETGSQARATFQSQADAPSQPPLASTPAGVLQLLPQRGGESVHSCGDASLTVQACHADACTATSCGRSIKLGLRRRALIVARGARLVAMSRRRGADGPVSVHLEQAACDSAAAASAAGAMGQARRTSVFSIDVQADRDVLLLLERVLYGVN